MHSRSVDKRPAPRGKGAAKRRVAAPGSTSWGPVADWYDDLLHGTEGTFQSEVILPNVLRIAALKGGERLIDIACGPGYFASEFAARGATVTGVDISAELIAHAERRRAGDPALASRLSYAVGSARRMPFLADGSFDIATVILAIQNIDGFADVFKEAARILRPDGRLVIVMNHPAFRVPKASEWGWDGKTQYRRVDRYLSRFSAAIVMHPGKDPRTATPTFHRPLSAYVAALAHAGFAVRSLEEWISHKTSDSGPRAAAENAARNEFPMFLCLEATRSGRR